MRSYLASLVVVLLGIGCGGTSESSNQTGGSSSGGASAGNNGAGASAGGTAGQTSGGSSSSGAGGRMDGTSGAGGAGVAGTGVVGGTGSGGGGVVDARCPATRPMGTCSAADEGLACQYDNFSACLCYANPAGTFVCQKVDPTCPNPNAAAAGAGGASAKIALPPLQVCSCAASTWTCHF